MFKILAKLFFSRYNNGASGVSLYGGAYGLFS